MMNACWFSLMQTTIMSKVGVGVGMLRMRNLRIVRSANFVDHLNSKNHRGTVAEPSCKCMGPWGHGAPTIALEGDIGVDCKVISKAQKDHSRFEIWDSTSKSTNQMIVYILVNEITNEMPSFINRMAHIASFMVIDKIMKCGQSDYYQKSMDRLTR
jgi:hypothetical protein